MCQRREPPGPHRAAPTAAPASNGTPTPDPPPTTDGPLEPVDESEPFEDPVEEADRLGSTPPSPGAPEA